MGEKSSPMRDVDIDDVECMCIRDVDCEVERLADVDELESIEADKEMNDLEKDDCEDILDVDFLVWKGYLM